jgi:hypothetical protein
VVSIYQGANHYLPAAKPSTGLLRIYPAEQINSILFLSEHKIFPETWNIRYNIVKSGKLNNRNLLVK